MKRKLAFNRSAAHGQPLMVRSGIYSVTCNIALSVLLNNTTFCRAVLATAAVTALKAFPPFGHAVSFHIACSHAMQGVYMT